MAEILRPLSFPLKGSRLIEASAGTGKTYTIAALYLRLILQHGGDNAFERFLTPPDILVLTFTEAATSELKDRIRARLAHAAEAFRIDDAGDDAFLRALIADYSNNEDKLNAAYRLDQAAQWMDEAAVSTIHSWCYRMLREHAFDSNSLFDMQLVTDDKEIITRCVEDYWRHFFYGYNSEALALLKLPASPEALLKEIKSLLSNDAVEYRSAGQKIAAAPNLPDQQSLIAHVEQQKALLRNTREKLAKAWPEIEENLRELYPFLNKVSFNKIKTEAEFTQFLQQLNAWIHAETEEKPVHFVLLATPVLRGKLSKKAENIPLHSAFSEIDYYLANVSDRAIEQSTLWLHAANWIRCRREEWLAQTASVGFDDMLRQLHRVLYSVNGDALAERILQQFPVILVDEFQDTDPVQYAIFDKIYQVAANHQDRGIFMIGDPKQAIYGFRGADIFTYLSARKATEGRHYSLATNYRSTNAMVEATNAIFVQAEKQLPLGAFRYKTADHNPLPFEAVNAQGKQQQFVHAQGLQKALEVWWLDQESEQKSISMGAYRAQMAEACASKIVDLLNDDKAGFKAENWRRLAPRDIAILVGNGSEADAVREALAQRNVATVYLSDKDSIFAQIEALDVLYLLQAVADHTDDAAIRRLLAAGSLQLSYAEIAAFEDDELQHENVLAILHELQGIWRRRGVLPMVRRFMQLYHLPERLAQLSRGERAITNWLHLAEWLQQQSVQAESEKALIRLLEQQIDHCEDDQEHVLRLESDADLIKVVTIHKSKGLQYPLVFLPFIAAFREASKKEGYYLYHDGDAAVIELDKSFDQALQAKDKERLDEHVRLLYVALTRAEYATFIGLAPVSRMAKQAPNLHKSAIGYLLLGDQASDAETIKIRVQEMQQWSQHIAVLDMPQIQQISYQTKREQVFAPAKKYQGQVPKPWWIASYSALHYGEQRVVDTVQEENWLEEQTEITAHISQYDVQGIHRFAKGAEAGVFLHDLLEWAANTGFTEVVNQSEVLMDYLHSKSRSHQWQEDVPMLAAWLTTFLTTGFVLDGKACQLKQLDHVMAEMEFWFSVHHVSVEKIDQLISQFILPGKSRPALLPAQLNGMLKGFIDLVFEFEQRYFVADYKSNWLGADANAYTQEAMENTILDKRYDVQLVLYSVALHRLLKYRQPNYCYEQHVGGAVYWFLRGVEAPTQGQFFIKPDKSLIDALDQLFKGEL